MRFLLLSILFLGSVHAASSYDCTVDAKTGDVHLQYTLESEKGTYGFLHFMGKENFIEPFLVRSECANLMSKLTESNLVPEEKAWSFYMCDYSVGIERLSLILELNNKKMYFSPVLLFREFDPINDLKLFREEEINTCDYDY